MHNASHGVVLLCVDVAGGHLRRFFRFLLDGIDTASGHLSGFFDAGSFDEILCAWARSVVAGRARLGGIPVGVVVVETRYVVCMLCSL